MKTKTIILSIVASISLSLGFSSCSDMLSPNSERHSYTVASDTLYSYWGILRSLQNVAERYVILGECRGDLVDGTGYVSDSIKSILDFDRETAVDGSCRYLRASDYYHIINSCNAYLAMADTTRYTGTNLPYMLKEYAQVEAIRAWVYLQLIQVYGEVPFYTEPLLTTDAINSFINDPNHEKVSADNLADKLEPYLAKALAVENVYGYPTYESYGYTSKVCHSTKCMIPINLILGDLFLTKGDKVSCEKAAQYYYNYLSNTQGNGKIAEGGALPSGYNYAGYQGEGMDLPEYSSLGGGCTWTETDMQDASKESITAIPSSTNKLWGTVLRGVNEVFGYTSEISVRTDANDSTTSASIRLYPQYDKKQLRASAGYFNICSEQDFEVMIGAKGKTAAEMTLTVDPKVGDCRQFWVKDVEQTYSNGLKKTEKFVTKQNPDGAFTTVYPMIYRKSMIWLRFAEALNRAGYPSYAFAILKNGLCKNDSWFPTLEEDAAIKDTAYYVYYNKQVETGEMDADDQPIYETKNVIYPEWVQDNPSQYRSKDEVLAAALNDGIEEADITSYAWEAASYENFCDENTTKVLYYLDMREVQKDAPFLNFLLLTFNGNYASINAPSRTSLIEHGMGSVTETIEGDDKGTVGIHSHGCGMIPLTQNKKSVFDYVKLIQKRAAEDGLDLSKEDIYSGAYDEDVQNYVEDLIVDEEALELAFEGTRFFDLMRVAHRRGDAKYLAERVSKRTGTKDASLYNKLCNSTNWYFPLPQY